MEPHGCESCVVLLVRRGFEGCCDEYECLTQFARMVVCDYNNDRNQGGNDSLNVWRSKEGMECLIAFAVHCSAKAVDAMEFVELPLVRGMAEPGCAMNV